MKNIIVLVVFFVSGGIAVLAQTESATTNRDIQDLATAERAFSATAVKEGFRDSFIKFFADDGIGFGPHPERTARE